jgi:hypothetical protein
MAALELVRSQGWYGRQNVTIATYGDGRFMAYVQVGTRVRVELPPGRYELYFATEVMRALASEPSYSMAATLHADLQAGRVYVVYIEPLPGGQMVPFAGRSDREATCRRLREAYLAATPMAVVGSMRERVPEGVFADWRAQRDRDWIGSWLDTGMDKDQREDRTLRESDGRPERDPTDGPCL